MEAETLERVFEPFFSTKEKGKGTGLGLATVYGIVKQSGGYIEVDSEPGQGTTFRIYLPRLDAAAVTVDRSARPAAAAGGTETILLVEDEADVRALMSKLLERHCYRVHAAADGIEALQIWQRHRDSIDLLVTDMVMPGGIGGRELGDRLQEDRPGLRVIYCSGYTDEMLGHDVPLRRRSNFLEKPFDVHVFLERVRATLDAPVG